MFTIRRMTPADKPAMLDISSRIWEGRDYIPEVFDRWVVDTDGEFAAVLLDGVLVGCGKLTFLTPADAWLEGLRKDPRVEERGMAEEVARHFLATLSRRPSLASVRFSTGARNLGSIRINEKLGFRRRAVLSRKAWEGLREVVRPAPLSDPSHAHMLVRTVDEEPAVLTFLDRSGYFTSTAGLMVEGWKAFPYSPGLLAARYVRPGHCRGILSTDGLRALSICTIEDLPSRTLVRLVCLDALDEESAGLMMDDVILSARAAADRAGANRCEIEWMVPRVTHLLKLAGYGGLRSREQEDDFFVYELPLDALSSFTGR